MGLSSIQISMWAFVFSLITVGFVVFISMHSRGNPITVVILAGVMVSSLFSAGVSYTKLVADPNDMLPAITYWLMGSLTGAKFADVKLVILPMAIGLVILLALRWRINILTMGDDEAATMGVNARLVRLLVMVAATLVTASSVAVSGMIGWVGLVIPHLCRMLVGCDYRKLLPASMVMGQDSCCSLTMWPVLSPRWRSPSASLPPLWARPSSSTSSRRAGGSNAYRDRVSELLLWCA